MRSKVRLREPHNMSRLGQINDGANQLYYNYYNKASKKKKNLLYFTEFQGLGNLVKKPKRRDKDAPFEG